MPRIRPRVLWQAQQIHRALPPLLPVCRDLPSARNELRWLAEHAVAVARRSADAGTRQHHLLASYVRRRAGGEPLQYILGSEYFGELEIKCRPGVLIPRPETAAAVAHLVHRLSIPDPNDSPLRILDLCTGTGCIPLLFHHEFYSREDLADRQLELLGVDISPQALGLARENLIHQIACQAKTHPGDVQRIRSLQSLGFVQADVLLEQTPSASRTPADSDTTPPLIPALERSGREGQTPQFDVLISNPPYISPKEFLRTTARSVRDFEPRLALVPSRSADEPDEQVADFFYPRLLRAADRVQAKVVLFEVADMAQAERVAALVALQGRWETIEIWRDEPGVAPGRETETSVGGRLVSICGAGNGRAVFARRKGSEQFLVR